MHPGDASIERNYFQSSCYPAEPAPPSTDPLTVCIEFDPQPEL